MAVAEGEGVASSGCALGLAARQGQQGGDRLEDLRLILNQEHVPPLEPPDSVLSLRHCRFLWDAEDPGISIEAARRRRGARLQPSLGSWGIDPPALPAPIQERPRGVNLGLHGVEPGEDLLDGERLGEEAAAQADSTRPGGL